MKNGVTFNHTDEQCLDGYSGALCLVCAKNYVLQGNQCEKCDGGSDFTAAFLLLVSLAFVVFLGILCLLVCAPSKKNASSSEKYYGQMKIILTFLQILASMPGVFDNVPWPKNFISFTFPLNVINMDFLSIFMKSTCSLSVPFLEKFLLHMMLPLLLLVAVLVSYALSRCCLKSNQVKLQRGKELLGKVLILGMFFLYPGLATQIFTVFRCKNIDGIDGQVLAADFSIKCHEVEHSMHALVAGAGLGVYIVGLPFGMFLVLYKNRKHLFDVASKEHERVKASFGGLYLQYEEEYWWFEMVVVLEKMIMTGAMCVIAPGSSLQLLVAVLVTLIYMLLVLKTAPYDEDSEDYTSFIACLTLTLTTVGGLLLITDNLSTPTYESQLLGAVLIAMSVCCIAAEIGIVVLIDCGAYEKVCGHQDGSKKKVSGGNKTQVLPVTVVNQENDLNARAEKAWENEKK